jgi:hypothetical protein
VNGTRLLLLLIVMIQLLMLSTLATRAFVEPSTFRVDPSPIDSADLPLTIESGYERALDTAGHWSAEAALLSVSMQVDWPLSVDQSSSIAVAPGGWIAYTFFDPANGSGSADATLSLFFERTSGVLVQQEVVDWPGNEQVNALDPEVLKIDSASALMTVEAREGRLWRSACPTDRHLSRISLTLGDAGTEMWVITYRDARADGSGLIARIDGTSGEIMSFEDRSEPCGEAT